MLRLRWEGISPPKPSRGHGTDSLRKYPSDPRRKHAEMDASDLSLHFTSSTKRV